MGVIKEKSARGEGEDTVARRVGGSHLPSFLALVLSKSSLALQLHEILQQAGKSAFFHLYPGEKIRKSLLIWVRVVLLLVKNHDKA